MSEATFPIELQSRDFLLLRGLFDSRIMTLSQISRLHFEGRDEAAKKRIQKLKAAGIISARPRRANEPAILFLAKKGFETLFQNGTLTHYPQFSLNTLAKRVAVSARTLQHELEVQEVKTSLTVAVNQTKTFHIGEFSTWPLLHEFRVTLPANGSTFSRPEILLKPDGFIRIMETDAEGQEFRRLFYLEVDRSSETLTTLTTKALAYREFYRTGGLAKKFGARKEDAGDYPFRVLLVCKTAERRNNVAETLLQQTPPILTMVWLTTFEELVADPLGAIWIRPIDYREEVTKDTAFAADRRRGTWGYKRQMEREKFVEQGVEKRRLFEEF